jgi:hypothetical protein
LHGRRIWLSVQLGQPIDHRGVLMKSVEITYTFHPSDLPPPPLPANTEAARRRLEEGNRRHCQVDEGGLMYFNLALLDGGRMIGTR